MTKDKMATEAPTQQFTMVELKAMKYDRLVVIEKVKMEMAQIDKLIAQLEDGAVEEPKPKKDVKK